MFRAIKRLFIYLGLLAEKATENDAINQAVVERGIRDSKEKAEKAHYANGQLQSQVIMLKDQIKGQVRKREELQGLLQAAAAANDEANGAHYAEELATIEGDITENEAQLKNLEELYQQNTQIIAASLREIQRFQREFETVKTKVAVGKNLENLATMMKGSITELQGMMGGEMSQSMQQLRQSASHGEGQMKATMDLAKEMGSGIARQQEMRQTRGKALFAEYKKKIGMVQPEAAAATEPAAAAPREERQKIAE
jgi:hypothetical protein